MSGTKLEQAMQQALSTDEALMALELILRDGVEHGNWPLNKNCEDGLKAITTLREALDQHKPHEECECSDCLNYFTDKAHEEALAEQAEQEPIHIENIYKSGDKYFAWIGDDYVQIYTAPVRTKDLTDDEIRQTFIEANGGKVSLLIAIDVEFARAVIAAYKAKQK